MDRYPLCIALHHESSSWKFYGLRDDETLINRMGLMKRRHGCIGIKGEHGTVRQAEKPFQKKNAEDLFHIVWRHLFYMSHPHILSINRQWIWSGLSILLDHPMNYKCLIFMLFTWWIDISDKCAVSLLKCVSDDGYIRRQMKHVEIWKRIFKKMGFMVQVAWMSSH